MKIIVKGIEITCSIEGIIKKINNMVWDSDTYTARPEFVKDASGYDVSENEFNEMKTSTVKFLKGLTEDKIIELAENNLRINKNGTLHKTAKNICYDIGNINSYSDCYGSHSYSTNGLSFDRIGSKSAELILTHINHQDSFQIMINILNQNNIKYDTFEAALEAGLIEGLNRINNGM